MRTQAIIIKKVPTNEFDQLVTCYTEDYGTLRALARGIYKPTSVQSLHLEPLNLVEFELIHGRSMPIISSAQMVSAFPNLRGSLASLAAAHFFAEVLDRISFENEKDPKLWRFLTETLDELNGKAAPELLGQFRAYQSEFLDVLGYAPQVSRCVVCSGPVDGPEKMVALSPELGGAMCADCFLASGRGMLFDRHDLAVLAGETPAGAAPAGGYSALDAFFEYTVGAKLHSLVFLYSVIQ